MAANSCSLTCNVKDSKGNVKVSALWKALDKFFKEDRRNALVHYFLTKDNNFLFENSDILEFDTDGEVTIASLKKALERDGEYSNLSNGRILRHLNDEIAGKYSYSEALDNVLKFNSSHQFKEGFMATLKPVERGKYSVEVVERNPSTEYDLASHVQNKILTDALRLILKDKGLSVEFLDNSSYAVQFSTQNVHLDADGLMAVANVLNGINTAPEVAEAAGHFIVASMQDSPLVQRLMDQLTPEVQEAIFRNQNSDLYRDDFIVAEASAKEAAGILIGKQLIHPFRQSQKSKAAAVGSAVPKAIKWLLSKIGEFAKRVLGIYKPDDVKKMVQEAKDMASTAAEGFISNPEEADVTKALNSPETYTGGNIAKNLSDEVKRNVRAFQDTLGSLKDMVVRLRESVGRAESPTNKDILKKLKLLTEGVTANYSPQMSMEAFAEGASIEGMVVVLEGITQILDNDVRSLLDQIQPSDRVLSYSSISTNARNMRTVNTAIKNIAELYLAISNKLDTLKANDRVQFPDADGNQVVTTLREAVSRLGDVLVGREETYSDTTGQNQIVNGIQKLMELKRRQIFIDAISNFYGKDYIDVSAGMVWQQKGFRSKLVKSGDRRIEVRDMIDSMEEDITWFDRYFNSAADCGDFVTAVGNKVTKNANMQADRLASLFWDRIEELRLQMQDVFGTDNCNMFFEVIRNAEGGLTKTGNLVSQVNYGEWENARHEFFTQLKTEFNEYLADLKKKAYETNKGVPGYVFRLSDMQRGVLWHKFTEPRWKKWHEENSEPDKTVLGSKRMLPNHVKYHNTQWDELFDTSNPTLSSTEKKAKENRLKLYNALLELKDDMDKLLPQNATVRWRAPQMTGRFSHRFRNLSAQMQKSRAAFGHAVRKKAQDWIVVRPDEAYLFGSNNEFNEIDNDPLTNPLFFEKEKIDRIPIFGVNKLKNMEDLSTDLFGTLMQYGSMAATYSAMERVVDVFELGRDVLKQRKVGNKVESNRNSESKAYSRYIKFLEKGVYGINVTPPSWDRKGMWRKFANNLSSLGGRILLWGNVHGGIVNTGTGMLEIYKEALAGENFNTDELWKAHQMYFNGLLSGDDDGIWRTVGNGLLDKQRPMDKNALWIRHWNILSENRAFLHNQKFDAKATSLLDNRLGEWFGNMMMLPYSSGEHYMQCIPYYAMGIHEQVYDHEGNRMNLIDAYEIVDGKEVSAIGDDTNILGKTPKKLKLKEGIFRSTEDIDKYDTVQGVLTKIEDFFNTHPNARNNQTIAPTMFTDAEREYLEDEDFRIPANVKGLASLKIALQLKAGELTFNIDDESAFMDKCRNICNRLHGIYNSEDKVTFQQNFYGNLVMAMRGYALGMINRRYASSKYNVPQGKVVEGSYNTFFKVLASALWNINSADNWRATGEALLLTVPFGNLALFSKNYGNRLKADMKKAGFSEHQYYNMRRTGADFLVLEALALLNFLSAPGRHFGLNDDPDEDKSKKNDTSDNFWAGLLYYFTMRWFNEQGAFTYPTAMINEGTSLLDYVPVGFSGTGAIADLLWLAVQTGWDQLDGEPSLDDSTLYYQTTKRGKYETGDSKAKIKFLKLCPYIRSWYQMSHPYDAASSYEYGRRIRGK